ncbi:transketolase family protein [Companilactobacillus furfuricola]|uniref:transketolase family protein n=1 Tax=Companilactobacillus furfuricola TaxID=1462575 RepID=UPI000F76BE11|nr:transketolase C-terminal domain-containing protein [Companilactobacillus furfuricola]
MSNQAKIGNVLCESLINATNNDKNIFAITSDSRGSASLAPFVEKFPDQIIEMGIAEQNSVTVASGLAHSGKRPFVFSPAAFLTMRSIEQVKVDVTYSNSNVKLIGISGGNSYSVLGATHHSLQDLAITRALPNLQVYMPADQHQARSLMAYLATSDHPAYVRIGKVALPDVYQTDDAAFDSPGKANLIKDYGNDAALISAGETLNATLEAAQNLHEQNINVKVIDLVSIKPIDSATLNVIADQVDNIITVEEHSKIGGLGSAVSEVLAPRGDTKINIIGFPDEPVIAGSQADVFKYYNMDANGIANAVKKQVEGR